ncbi:MAG: hypothetical protein ACKOSR_03270, partial [Flavobacteriales bacterium]
IQAFGQLNGAISQFTPSYNDTVWTIKGKQALGPAVKKVKLDFVLDGRQTLISNKRTRLAGLRVGLEIRRVHRIGVGFYGLGDGVELDALPEINPAITKANLKLAYQSLYYERVLHFSRKWEWSATCHFGRGKVTGNYELTGASGSNGLPEQKLRVMELSATGYYNINYWLSAGAGFGYRFMYGLPDEIDDVYEAPVAIVRVRIKLGKLVKSIWDKDTQNLF